MGGKTWDDYIPPKTKSSGGWKMSTDSATAFKATSAKSNYLAKNRELVCTAKNPIVVVLDVTGSMGNAAKVLRDKCKAFYGQIIRQEYLPDPAMSFAAIGDAECDKSQFKLPNS